MYVYNLLHKDQLHISALGNGHLQVEIEKLMWAVHSPHKSSIAAY